MRKIFIIGALIASFTSAESFVWAAMTNTVAYKVTVTIPERVELKAASLLTSEESFKNIAANKNSDTTIEKTFRDHQPVLIQSIVVK